jgi:hypothetical protein
LLTLFWVDAVLVGRGGETGVRTEPQEFDRFVSGFVEVDVGVGREAIRTEDIRLPRMLHAYLWADECETLTFNLAPDLFFAGQVGVWLDECHGKDFYRDNALHRDEAISAVEEAVRDMGPMTARSWTDE